VEFLKGDIEAIPLPDSVVDVVISNCVINLIRRAQGLTLSRFGRPAVRDRRSHEAHPGAG
jgi:ubiquinone/menaquinone biosynthesis C-methylase UbiE